MIVKCLHFVCCDDWQYLKNYDATPIGCTPEKASGNTVEDFRIRNWYKTHAANYPNKSNDLYKNFYSKCSKYVHIWVKIFCCKYMYILATWLNYDVQFRTFAAFVPSLFWDVCHTDMWLQCITTPPPAVHYPWQSYESLPWQLYHFSIQNYQKCKIFLFLFKGDIILRIIISWN